MTVNVEYTQYSTVEIFNQNIRKYVLSIFNIMAKVVNIQQRTVCGQDWSLGKYVLQS